MTNKFKEIIRQLDALVTFKADKPMTDDDFIANIEAINLLINLHDDLNLDRTILYRRMSRLFPELIERISVKENIQNALPLIKALNDFIYGRQEDRGREIWQNTLKEMCCKVVDAYHKEPVISSTDYLFALDIVGRMNDDDDNNSDIKEYKETIASLVEDIDNISVEEKIRRVEAYSRSKHLFVSDNWMKWAEVREMLKLENVKSLDDESFLMWCNVTDNYPPRELKRRSSNSGQMMVEYLRSQIISEFARQDRLRTQRKLATGLKSLNDEIIGDIIPLKIDSKMSVSTLFALETIFYLRLQLAQIFDDKNTSVYESLCIDRFEKIANALAGKYPSAETLNEKIEILERLSIIGSLIHSTHEDFAIEEAACLKELPDLTYSQQMRLDWIPSITAENESVIVAKLLPDANTAFEMGTLALITDYVSDQEREAILNRYFDLLDTAIAAGDTAEIGKLLALSADWNSNPYFRQRIKEQTAKLFTHKSSLLIDIPHPQRRVNNIVAEVYTQIDHLSGNYDNLDIPA